MKLMTQDVQRWDEVAPLDQLSQWPASERCLRYSNFIQDCTRMHQDLFGGFTECISFKRCWQVANIYFLLQNEWKDFKISYIPDHSVSLVSQIGPRKWKLFAFNFKDWEKPKNIAYVNWDLSLSI